MPEEQEQHPQVNDAVGPLPPQPPLQGGSVPLSDASKPAPEPSAAQEPSAAPEPNAAQEPKADAKQPATPAPATTAENKSATPVTAKSLPTAQQLPSLVGEEISGCEILQKTAAGGMGAVYRARHKALNRIVCVKILAPALANDKKAVDLFLTEARAIAELDHPNIVNVYNVGKEKGYYFIVMSFVEGQTLSQMLRKQKVLPIGLVLDLFEGVLLGLQAAHEKGIIHRDIKPSNILIDTNMQPKVVDFGIAKKMDKEKGAAKSTELAGTAYFIAPEQALGKNVDTRADLYAVGASLYYVLTGHFPYNGKNTMEIIQKHIKDPIPNPANLRPDIPVWLAQAVQKLMSKKPENRFRTAKEVVDFFRKMRADDQLRITEENAGKAINLSQEGGLKLYTEDEFLAPDEKQKKVQEPPLKLMEMQGLVPQQAPKADLPSLEAAAAAAPVQPAPAEPTPQQQQQEPAAHLENTDTDLSASLQNQLAKKKMSKWIRLSIMLPIFVVFNFLLAYLFYKLGTICSALVHPGYTFLQTLYVPLFANVHTAGQLFFMAAGIICLVMIFAASKFRQYSGHTLMLLALALLAYIGGLYAPNVGFLDASGMAKNILSASCFIGYLILSFIVTWFIGKTYNRSVALGVLGSAFVGLTVLLMYLAAHTTYPPAMGVANINVLFFGTILFSMLSIYFLVMPQHRANSIMMPTVCLLVALGCGWLLTVSGLAVHTLGELDKLISRVRVHEIKQDMETKQPEELKEFLSQPNAVRMFTKQTEFSNKTPQEIAAALKPRLFKMVPPGTFNEQNFEDFTRFLATRYHEGDHAMRAQVWMWAAAVPFQRFKEDAPENHIYSWMIWMLILFNISTCAAGMILKEDDIYEQL